MHRILTGVSLILMFGTAPVFAQQGKSPDGRPIDPAGIQGKTPDGRPIDPSGIQGNKPDGAPIAPAAHASMILTEAQALAWIAKPVYSSDGQKIGNVAAFARATDGKVNEMHADIGGFLGLGVTHVRLMPAQFTLAGDRATINVTGAQAKDLPKVAK